MFSGKKKRQKLLAEKQCQKNFATRAREGKAAIDSAPGPAEILFLTLELKRDVETETQRLSDRITGGNAPAVLFLTGVAAVVGGVALLPVVPPVALSLVCGGTAAMGGTVAVSVTSASADAVLHRDYTDALLALHKALKETADSLVRENAAEILRSEKSALIAQAFPMTGKDLNAAFEKAALEKARQDLLPPKPPEPLARKFRL